MSDQWCGICNAYVDHDTAHHEAAMRGGRFTEGDAVKDSRDGRIGRVERVRGPVCLVAFKGNRGKTASEEVHQEHLEFARGPG